MIHWLYFIMSLVYGACVGSFLNVVVYRLPLGKSLVSPPSACPRCDHKLAWYDNVPVLGWLWLRGRCRYCANPISPQYPILEGFCAVMFGMLFLAYYHTGDRVEFLVLPGRDSAMVFVLHLFLLAGLIAASKIDAHLYIIPLQIPWTVTIIALLGFPLAAAVFPASAMLMPAVPVWGIGAAIGGAIGLIVAFALLQKKILPMSFLEPEPEPVVEVKKEKKRKDKKKEEREAGVQALGVDAGSDAAPVSARTRAIYLLIITAVAIVLWFTLGAWGRFAGFVLLWWGVLLIDFGAYGKAADLAGAGPEHWFIHPRPRFEAMKEILYLALPVLLGIIGAGIATLPAVEPALAAWPLPVKALAGVIFGYLIGCGVVWGVRILGTLMFGKEAMGLGDVHLVGAIGAVIGACDATVAFMMAAFFGLGYALVEATLGRLLVKRGVQIPYGPHLCGAAIVLMLFRDPIQNFAVVVLNLPILCP